MKKLIIALLTFLVAAATVNAGVVTPVDCEELFDEPPEFVPKMEWDEPADICFHGVGFPDGELGVELKIGESTFDFEPVAVIGGSFSSISGDVPQLFSGVPAGVYTLAAGDMEYEEDIVVHGEDGGQTEVDPPQDEGGNQNPAEVPEFTTITSLLVLAGAGWYVNRKKRGLLQ